MARSLALQAGFATFQASKLSYLNCASAAALQGGNVDMWWAGWVYINNKPANQMPFITKYNSTGNQREYQIYWDNATDRITLLTNSDGTAGTGVLTAANTFGAPSLATPYFVIGYHDVVNHVQGISVNGGAFDTAARATGVFGGTADFMLGKAQSASVYLSGQFGRVAMGKSPLGGIAALATTIRDALYNGGYGLSPAQFSAAQKTAWGVVGGWLDTTLTGDVIGSNTLTANNEFFFTPSASRSVATNRNTFSVPVVQSAVISPGGNALTLGWSLPVTAGSGTPTLTLDGTSATLTLAAHLDRTSTYTITSGNAGSNPALYGATAVCTVPSGLITFGGVGNAAATPTVTQGSNQYNQANFVAASSQYLSIADTAGLRTGNVDWLIGFNLRQTTFANGRGIICKGDAAASPCDFEIRAAGGTGGFIRCGVTDGSTLVEALSSPTMVVGNAYSILCWFDSVAKTLNIFINGVSAGSQSTAAITPATSTNTLYIGQTPGFVCLDGKVANVVFGKSLPGGFATTPGATIAAALWNGGNPLRPSKISSAQRTAWGIVSGWLETTLTADVIGPNTLTNNNTVTLTTGALS